MTTVTTPTVSDEQAAILAAHAHVVQGGFSTPEIERERLLKDAAGAADPQAFINETVGKFAAEVLQAQLAAADRASASVAEPEPAAAEVIKPDTFEFMGEYLEVSPEVGWALAAEYRTAAAALHEAKRVAKDVEQKIMEQMRGFEAIGVDGQTLFTWKFVDSTSFDAREFKAAGPDYKALYDHFCKTKTTRRFRAADGTVGVD